MVEKIQALIDSGLTQNEARVYLAMLSLGSANVNAIARKAGVHRVNAYDLIERLIQKGLVSSSIKGTKHYYDPASPNELLKLSEQKHEEVKSIVPELMLEYDMRKEKQEVLVFKGPQGVMTAYNLMLAEQQPLYALGGQGLNRKYLKHRHEQFEKERIERKIRVYGLYYESSREKRLERWGWKVKYLPDEFKSPLMIDICGNLVVELLATDDIMAIVIKNKAIADGYRKHFNLMWKFAKE